MKKLNIENGFTLIELVVIVSVVSVLMITLTTVLINAFKASNRVAVSDRLEQNGNNVLMELKNNFLKASGVGITCPLAPSSGSTISFVNKNDGQLIRLECISNGLGGYKIASTSADLISGGVVVSSCSAFVSCENDSDGEVAVANFSFTLSAGATEAGVENYASRKFESKVVLR